MLPSLRRAVAALVATACGCAAGADPTGGDPGPDLVDAVGVSITGVALYQGVEIPLVVDGAPAPAAHPIIAGRQAFVRVFASPGSDYHGAKITARLTIGGGDPIEVTQALSAPVEADLATTLNFAVPGASLAPGATLTVDLLQPSDGGGASNAGAHVGPQPLDVRSVGPNLRVRIIPIAYGADGSNRLPDVSDAQLQRYRDRFFQLYPVPDVEVTVGSSFAWAHAVQANGSGWMQLLDALSQRHAQEDPDRGVYYFGAFDPAASSGQFCGAACVAGLGTVGSPGDVYSHTAIGLGFAETAADTAVHETGHNHGREHAPCGGTSGVDPNYPYPQAAIGVPGFDLLGTRIIPPQAKDMMAYCMPIWISDYNFFAIADRVAIVNGARVVVAADEADRLYERVRVSAGEAAWLDPVRLPAPPTSPIAAVDVDTDESSSTVDAHVYGYDHLDGGVYLWPRRPGTRGATVHTSTGAVHLVAP